MDQYKTGQEEFTFAHGIVYTCSRMGQSKVVFTATSPCVKSSWQQSIAACDVFSIAVTGFIKFVTVIKKALENWQ